MNDYRRPADYQIKHHYTCVACGEGVETESCYGAPMLCPCGGRYEFSGESYPADSQEWDEERNDINDEFHTRR
jgi:hypothetical protein